MLKRWMALPLKDIVSINDRLNIVEYMYENASLREDLIPQIKKMGDVERIISRVAAGKVTPREMQQLKVALVSFEEIKEKCLSTADNGIVNLGEKIDPCAEVREKIERELQEDPPALVNKGNVIASGVSSELDELRDIVHSGKDFLA